MKAQTCGDNSLKQHASILFFIKKNYLNYSFKLGFLIKFSFFTILINIVLKSL